MRMKKGFIVLCLFIGLLGCSQSTKPEEVNQNDLVEVLNSAYSKVEVRFSEAEKKQYDLRTVEKTEEHLIFANIDQIEDYTPDVNHPLLTIEVEVVDLGGTPYLGSETYTINANKKEVTVVVDHFNGSTLLVAHYPFSETQDLVVTIVGSHYQLDELKSLMAHLVESIQILK